MQWRWRWSCKREARSLADLPRGSSLLATSRWGCLPGLAPGATPLSPWVPLPHHPACPVAPPASDVCRGPQRVVLAPLPPALPRPHLHHNEGHRREVGVLEGAVAVDQTPGLPGGRRIHLCSKSGQHSTSRAPVEDSLLLQKNIQMATWQCRLVHPTGVGLAYMQHPPTSSRTPPPRVQLKARPKPPSHDAPEMMPPCLMMPPKLAS